MPTHFHLVLDPDGTGRVADAVPCTDDHTPPPAAAPQPSAPETRYGTERHIHHYHLAHEPHGDCAGTAPEWPSEPVYRIEPAIPADAR